METESVRFICFFRAYYGFAPGDHTVEGYDYVEVENE